jgi:hydrogenase/urease accessory protein HupE
MDQFNIFLQQGFLHILDLSGYDHIMFLFAICAIYSLKDWKQILWIVSSFTIAHSITLALGALHLIVMNSGLIEFLIAFTIFFTCIENLFFSNLHRYRMVFSFIFGLVHGMGFSRLLIDLFMGMEFNFLSTLLPFNLGLEVGQLVIITAIVTLIYILQNMAGLKSRTINYLISVPVCIQATIWMVQRWPF